MSRQRRRGGMQANPGVYEVMEDPAMATIERRTIPARQVADPVTGKTKARRELVRWDARWRDSEGRSRRKAFEREGAARAFLKETEKATDRGVDTSARARKTTLAEFASTYLDSTDLTSRTVALYRLTLSTVPFVHQPLATITPTDIRGWLVGLGKDGRPGVDRQGRPVLKPALALGTRRMHAARVRVLLEAAVEDKLLTVSPYSVKATRKVLGARDADTEAVRPDRLPGHNVVGQILAEMTPRYRVAVVLAAYCGLRSGELRALTLADFDPLHRRLHVRASMVRERQGDGSPELRGKLKTTASGTGAAGMEISAEVALLISDHVNRFASGGPDSPLMPTERGAHCDANTMAHFFRQARARAGAPQVRLHDLRHYGVSSQIAAGASVAEAQAFARHASPRMTLSTYVHAFGDTGASNAERMGQVLALSHGRHRLTSRVICGH